VWTDEFVLSPNTNRNGRLPEPNAPLPRCDRCSVRREDEETNFFFGLALAAMPGVIITFFMFWLCWSSDCEVERASAGSDSFCISAYVRFRLVTRLGLEQEVGLVSGSEMSSVFSVRDISV